MFAARAMQSSGGEPWVAFGEMKTKALKAELCARGESRSGAKHG